MNPDRLLSLYERVAEAPDAIAQLRRFALAVAVRGKLVEQDTADEPASELLKRLAAEKVRLVQAGEIRKQKILPTVEEPPFCIPENWRWTRMREVTSDRGQRVPDAAFTYIDVTAIDKDNGLVVGPKVLEPGEAPSRARKVARLGDVIYSCVRPYLLNVAVIEEDFDPTPIASTAFAVLNGHGFVLPRYLWIVLRSPFMVACVEQNQRGQAYPAINDADFAALPFPLPPLAEQRRIVAKVNDLMALCDRLEEGRIAREDTRNRLTKASFARLSAPDMDEATFRSYARFAANTLPALTARADQVAHIRQTILNLAVQGKLVEQDTDDESVSELLNRIAKAKARLKQETGDYRIRPAADPKSGDFPGRLPDTWKVQSFENLFLFIDYRGKTPPKTDAGIPLITAKNIRFGNLNREPREFMGEGTFKKWMTRGVPRLGDIFFTTEAPLANVCLNDIPEPFAIAQRVICLQPYGGINTRYFMFAIMSDVMQKLIGDHSTGLTAKGIKTAKLKPLPVPVPPLAEQHRIVARVDQLMFLCNALRAALSVANATRGKLLQAILNDTLAPAENA